MQAQTAALNRGIDLQQNQYNDTVERYAPYTAAGTSAIGHYGDLVGNNGTDVMRAAVQGLQADPFFQQNLDNANTNLLQTASATGGVRGGNTAMAVGQLSPALLQQYYQNALSNYGNLAQLGLGATGSVAGAGLANANAQTGLQGAIGDAQANNFLTKGGINARTINGIGSFLDQAAGVATGGAGGAGFSLSKALGSIF